MTEKGGYGHSVTLGDHVAILVVDMTKEFVDDRYPNGFAETGQPAVAAVDRLLSHTTEAGIRTYFSRARTGGTAVEGGQWSETTSGGVEKTDRMLELADGLSPGERDVVFDKYKPSAFFGTQLESMLNAECIDSLIVTGMTTSGCVRATVVDAFSYNYPVKIPVECVADRSQISHDVSLFDMDMKYADVVELDELIEELE